MSEFPDLDGPWELTDGRSPTITGNWIPTVIDANNQWPLWSAHTYLGVYERIVEDHNRPRSGTFHTAVIEHRMGKEDLGGFDYDELTLRIAKWCIANWTETIGGEPDPEADADSLVEVFFDNATFVEPGKEAYLHRAQFEITFPLK